LDGLLVNWLLVHLSLQECFLTKEHGYEFLVI
jgi:hypothetical protein